MCKIDEPNYREILTDRKFYQYLLEMSVLLKVKIVLIGAQFPLFY